MIAVILAVAGTLLLIAAGKPALEPAPVRIHRRRR